MEAPDHLQGPSHPSAGRWALGVAAALVAYVLSIGPVSAWVERYPPSEIGWKVIDTVYQPIVTSFRKPWARDSLFAYQQWWERRLGAHSSLFQRRPGEGPLGRPCVLIPVQRRPVPKR